MQNSSSGSSSKAKTGSSQPSEASLKRKRGVFQKDLQHMMYGFGDDPNPLPETVALVEDIVVEYVTDLAMEDTRIFGSSGINFSLPCISTLLQNTNFSSVMWAMFRKTRISINLFNYLKESQSLQPSVSVKDLKAHKAQDIASKRGKLLTEDFLFLIRKDLPKLHRCTELLSMNEELKQARKAFELEEDKYLQNEA